MLFGHSQALDLLGLLETESYRDKEEVNLLIVGAGDGRHVIQTMAKWYKHATEAKINFYVAEGLMDLVARQLLLLLIALEPPERLGPTEKARLWMEVYGNTLLRASTAEYVQAKGEQIVHLVTDPDYLVERLPVVTLDKLKYKEKDALECIGKFWTTGGINIEKCWDERQRKSLQARYDSREGVYDWDYQMRLREVSGTEQIGPREYKTWRKTGVGFLWLETEASVPNPTFACGARRVGDSFESFGYLGDTETGPFFAFGLDAPDDNSDGCGKTMTGSMNGIKKKRSTEVFERNLLRAFHEIERGPEPFAADPNDVPDLGLAVVQVGTISSHPPKPIDLPRGKEEYSALQVPHKVIFLPANSLSDLHTREEFSGRFDLLYLAHNVHKLVKPEIAKVLSRGGLAVLESRKYLVGPKKEEKASFEGELKGFAKAADWEALGDFDVSRDEYALFKAK